MGRYYFRYGTKNSYGVNRWAMKFAALHVLEIPDEYQFNAQSLSSYPRQLGDLSPPYMGTNAQNPASSLSLRASFPVKAPPMTDICQLYLLTPPSIEDVPAFCKTLETTLPLWPVCKSASKTLKIQRWFRPGRL